MHICYAQGCDKEVVAKGLCDTHYRRFQRHGHIEETRPPNYGVVKEHPLRHVWSHMKRSGKSFCEEWKVFSKFVEDVGERPENCRFLPIDDTQPMSKSNFKWVTKSPDKDRARYAREYRRNNVEKVRDQEFKNKFGITLDDYNKLSESQNHVCAICGKQETHTIRGKVLRLAVDHNHETSKVRGLLCAKCNTAIGLLNESEQLLNNAITYLNERK